MDRGEGLADCWLARALLQENEGRLVLGRNAGRWRAEWLLSLLKLEPVEEGVKHGLL